MKCVYSLVVFCLVCMSFVTVKADNSASKVSNNGLEIIKQFEGFRSTAYKCPAGYLTIGYGHRILNGESFPNGVTKEQATSILIKDCRIAENAIRNLVQVELNQNQYDALVSFIMNVGQGNFKSSTLLKKLNNGDFQGAADEFPRWNKGGGKVLNGLVARRKAERELFLR